MKKHILFALILFSVALIACESSDSGASNNDANTEQIDANAEAVVENNLLDEGDYTCPMECNDGKVYEKPGVCPSCAMQMKLVE